MRQKVGKTVQNTWFGATKGLQLTTIYGKRGIRNTHPPVRLSAWVLYLFCIDTLLLCTNTLLYKKFALYPLRKRSEWGLFQRASEHERKDFEACSQGLWNKSRKASEQTAYIQGISLFTIFIIKQTKLQTFPIFCKLWKENVIKRNEKTGRNRESYQKNSWLNLKRCIFAHSFSEP